MFKDKIKRIQPLEDIKIYGVGLQTLFEEVNRQIGSYGPKTTDRPTIVRITSAQSVARISLNFLENQINLLIDEREKHYRVIEAEEKLLKQQANY